MKKKKTELQMAQEEAIKAAESTNQKIEELGNYTSALYDTLNTLQSVIDEIRKVPEDKKLEIEDLKKIRLNWVQQVKKIESEYKAAEMKALGTGAAGAGAGIAVAALGPTAAMGVATTFGVASTGTAISTLSGAAATNAALAWIGGGTLAAGGGGMAAGNVFLALAGPVGWTIAGVTLLGSGLMFFKGRNDKKRLESIFTAISYRDIKSYQLAIVELNERIVRIINETVSLTEAISEARRYGINYDEMTEEQQYKLIAFVNLMCSSTQLLVNPILGLQPRYTEKDLEEFYNHRKGYRNKKFNTMYVALANLLYMILLDDTDKKLLLKSLRKNKDFLQSMDISKNEFELSKINFVWLALKRKYQLNEEKSK